KALHREHTGIVIGHAHASRGVDDVLPCPTADPGPPAAVRDRHQRLQRHVGVATLPHLLRYRHEGLCGAGLEPHAAADDLAEPGKTSRVTGVEIGRFRLVEQAAHHVDQAELVCDFGCGDQPS